MYFMMSSASPETYVSESGLLVGHLNVYHLFNKVPGVPTFLCNQYPFVHMFGLSETRFNCLYQMNRLQFHIIPYTDAILQSKVKQAWPFMFIILYKILPLGVRTWSHNALKAFGWKFAILKHRPC